MLFAMDKRKLKKHGQETEQKLIFEKSSIGVVSQDIIIFGYNFALQGKIAFSGAKTEIIKHVKLFYLENNIILAYHKINEKFFKFFQ